MRQITHPALSHHQNLLAVLCICHSQLPLDHPDHLGSPFHQVTVERSESLERLAQLRAFEVHGRQVVAACGLAPCVLVAVVAALIEPELYVLPLLAAEQLSSVQAVAAAD